MAPYFCAFLSFRFSLSVLTEIENTAISPDISGKMHLTRDKMQLGLNRLENNPV